MGHAPGGFRPTRRQFVQGVGLTGLGLLAGQNLSIGLRHAAGQFTAVPPVCRSLASAD